MYINYRSVLNNLIFIQSQIVQTRTRIQNIVS